MAEQLGDPEKIHQDRSGNEVRSYGSLTATFDEAGLAEIGFLPDVHPRVAGLPILGSQEQFRALLAADGDPREYLGFVVLLRLGVTVTGMHDGDGSQLAATAFRAGRWDPLREKLKPLAVAR